MTKDQLCDYYEKPKTSTDTMDTALKEIRKLLVCSGKNTLKAPFINSLLQAIQNIDVPQDMGSLLARELNLYYDPGEKIDTWPDNRRAELKERFERFLIVIIELLYDHHGNSSHLTCLIIAKTLIRKLNVSAALIVWAMANFDNTIMSPELALALLLRVHGLLDWTSGNLENSHLLAGALEVIEKTICDSAAAQIVVCIEFLINVSKSILLDQKVIQQCNQAMSKIIKLPTNQCQAAKQPKNQRGLCLEMDGSKTTEDFTVLTKVKGELDMDQKAHIEIISLLPTWISATKPLSKVHQSSEIEHKSQDHEVSSKQVFGQANVSQQNFTSSILTYCLRTLNKYLTFSGSSFSKKGSDSESEYLVKTLVDTVDQLGVEISAQLIQLIKQIALVTGKRLYTAKSNKSPHFTLHLCAVSFLMSHEDLHDKEAFLVPLFEKHIPNIISFPGSSQQSLSLSTKLLYFCHKQAKFLRQSGIISKYFPSLLRAIAWQPSSLLHLATPLLPLLCERDNVLGLFNAILDLPATTIAMHILNYEQTVYSSKAIKQSNTPVENIKIGQALESDNMRAMIEFFNRLTAETGNTLQNSGILFRLFEECRMVEKPRVFLAAQTACVLLDAFLSWVTYGALRLSNGGASIIEPLILVMLERSLTIIQVAGKEYETQLHRIMAKYLPTMICKCQNTLVMCIDNILRYLTSLENYLVAEPVMTSLLYSIGENLRDQRSLEAAAPSPNQQHPIQRYFDACEMCLFELTQKLAKTWPSPRVLILLMSTMTKLAARSSSDDPLLSRCLLALVKVTRPSRPIDMPMYDSVVRDRARELVAALASPDRLATEAFKPLPFQTQETVVTECEKAVKTPQPFISDCSKDPLDPPHSTLHAISQDKSDLNRGMTKAPYGTLNEITVISRRRIVPEVIPDSTQLLRDKSALIKCLHKLDVYGLI